MGEMTADELIKHPEFANVTWKLEAAQKGKVSVANGRGGPFDIAYEVHGHGPVHLLWIMGLGSLKTSWQRQTKDFAHDRSSEYTSLIFDNRGMGESDKPWIRYSTSEMARDALELLDHVGWTEKRSVHVVGISMGGMIGQELASLIPERIASLTLLSTAARIVNTVGFFENLRNRINMFIPKSMDNQVAQVKRACFSDAWLAEPDVDGNFPTNGDRFAAQEISKRQDPNNFPRHGFVLQAIAAGWHHKNARALKRLADAVGRERIQVIHGDLDRMIPVVHGETLVQELNAGDDDQKQQQQPVRYTVFKGYGHVLPMERRVEFRELMLDFLGSVRELPA